jgi:hypothetical protein
MMKHFPLVLLLLLSYSLQAQRKSKNQYLECGFLFGLTNYSGDVAEKPIQLNETQPGYGVFVRYHLTPKFAIKAQLYSGSIRGDDKNSAVLYDRKFKFSTNILETAAILEWDFLGKPRYSKTGLRSFNLSPYLFIGTGVAFVTPDAQYYGPPDKRNDYLKVPFPEGNLNNKILVFPMGFGAKADVLERFVLGLDIGWRLMFSDDLDGVSINGNPKQNDLYYFVGITTSFIITGK